MTSYSSLLFSYYFISFHIFHPPVLLYGLWAFCSILLDYYSYILDLYFFAHLSSLWRAVTNFLVLFAEHCYHSRQSNSFFLLFSEHFEVIYFICRVFPFQISIIELLCLRISIFQFFLLNLILFFWLVLWMTVFLIFLNLSVDSKLI